MKGNAESLAEVAPSATPSEEEIRLWETLPRDEQLRRLRAVLAHPDCGLPVGESMDKIAALARERK